MFKNFNFKFYPTILTLVFVFYNTLFPPFSKAQNNYSVVCKQKADLILQHYNSEHYDSIYSLFSTNYKNGISELSFQKFCDSLLFKPYGKIQYQSGLDHENTHCNYFVQFEKMGFNMRFTLNERQELNSLDFVPYQAEGLLKRNLINSDNPLKTEIDSFIDLSVKSYLQNPNNCGLSIAILKDREAHFYNYGEVARYSNILPSENTVYEIGAISSSFTGILLAFAIKEAKLSLEDDIRKHLPAQYPHLSYHGNSIQIKHLACHSTALPGIPDDLNLQANFDPINPYKNYDKKMFLENLRRTKPDAPPGQNSRFSHYDFAILGLILEEVYKMNYSDLLKQKILGLNQMTCVSVSSDSSICKNYARAYNGDGVETKHWDTKVFTPVLGIRASSKDLLKFLTLNLNGNDTLNRIVQKNIFKAEEQISMAWQISTEKFTEPLYWSNGGTFGFSSFTGFMKNQKLALVVLSNGAMRVDYLAIKLLKRLSLEK